MIEFEQEYTYDGNGRRHSTIETVQCRNCGSMNRTINDLVAQHWVDFGCPACQKRHTVRAFALLERAQIDVQHILEHGLNDA